MTPQEYTELVEPLRSRMLRNARRYVGNATDAEDIVQDALLRLWEMGDRLHRVKNLGAMSAIVVRNLSINLLKRRAFLGNPVSLWQLVSIAADPHPAEVSSDYERLRCLIGTLPARQQEVFRLRHVEELETDEIARLLGMTAEAVRMNLSRARNHIRKLFNCKS